MNKFIKVTSNLSEEEKLQFYERFAMNLTISNRDIWSEETCGDSDKVKQMKWMNELMHQVLLRMYSLRRGNEDSSDEKFWKTICHWASLNKISAGHIGGALNCTYEFYDPMNL